MYLKTILVEGKIVPCKILYFKYNFCYHIVAKRVTVLLRVVNLIYMCVLMIDIL